MRILERVSDALSQQFLDIGQPSDHIVGNSNFSWQHNLRDQSLLVLITGQSGQIFLCDMVRSYARCAGDGRR